MAENESMFSEDEESLTPLPQEVIQQRIKLRLADQNLLIATQIAMGALKQNTPKDLQTVKMKTRYIQRHRKEIQALVRPLQEMNKPITGKPAQFQNASELKK